MSTINYRWPISGTTAPTAAQVVDQSAVEAQYVMVDSDVVATIVHNMALTTAQLASGFPFVHNRLTSAPTTTVYVAPFTVDVIDGNTVTVNKNAQTGSACTGEVVILRPNTSIT
jgi:hypothetical protein